MPVQVEIAGAGAFIAPRPGARPRPTAKGAVVEVDEETAERLLASGAAVPAGSVADPEPESSEDEGDLFEPDGMTIGEMLAWADEHGLDLPDDLDESKRAPVIEAIESAIEEEE